LQGAGLTTRLAGATALLLAICLAGVASAEVITGGNVTVTFTGSMLPRRLSRDVPQPIALSVNARVDPVGEGRPPSLQRFTIAFNRHALVSTRGLPTCSKRVISGRTTQQALVACRDALVGTGLFTAHLDIPDQAPFPARGIFAAPFKIARGTFYLADGTIRTRVLSGSCRVAR
jgi:hypothetical protein